MALCYSQHGIESMLEYSCADQQQEKYLGILGIPDKINTYGLKYGKENRCYYDLTVTLTTVKTLDIVTAT